MLAAMNSNWRRARGDAAEELAAAYLAARGLTILARNVRCKGGELDLVCLDGEVLALIEVRQRSSAGFGGALASVTAAKRRKIVRDARHLLRTTAAWRNRPMRFDVIGFEGPPDGAYEIAWIRDAFRAT